MDIAEYTQVCHMSYCEYCEYLQRKYKLSPVPYFDKSFQPNENVSRECEGLYIHHTKEDVNPFIEECEVAKKSPFEWQEPQNLVYCDLLEHLFLHILLNEIPQRNDYLVDYDEISLCFIPLLNDIYSGYWPQERIPQIYYSVVSNDCDAFLALVARFLSNGASGIALCESYNAPLGLWQNGNNQTIYKAICQASDLVKEKPFDVNIQDYSAHIARKLTARITQNNDGVSTAITVPLPAPQAFDLSAFFEEQRNIEYECWKCKGRCNALDAAVKTTEYVLCDNCARACHYAYEMSPKYSQ